MKKTYYFGHINKNANDGGQSRNRAFRHAFESIGAIPISVYSNNNFLRFFYTVNAIRILLFSSKNKIFLHQGTIISLFPFSIMKYDFAFSTAFKIIEKAIKSNAVTVEINDLPYEQSIDLELPVNATSKKFQDKLYSFRSAKYIFASHKMAEFVEKKFDINYDVVINGSNELRPIDVKLLSKFENSRKRKFIYAGSLSKGRQIEALISKFEGKQSLLVLIGESGEWLEKIELPENILYLGQFPEDQAQVIVSKCDMGIIPYSASRFYYNICYPTKASFYIASGIPFLSTPLSELMAVFDGRGMAQFMEFANWGDVIDDDVKLDLSKMRTAVSDQKHKFYWDNLLSFYIKKFNNTD